ncbi:aldo/keto reductase [Caldivirga maquilingensis]|uniref:Aldo/keto reductase n=1 Tax=Caldivirga maquilingensis (strain ATCC 700844 / DSM 13496 / JCM 10307 / IC-167) TaxID=397948 RepID=A8MBX3_CALMQ|nr:aldo/keto reductase [Caldivirga maquilingensis]ABW01316.1 aldo/keto reductase [Caldivirga maquilingensis IC-167]
MEYVKLGWSGLKVSKIAFGAMSIGDPNLQSHGSSSWVAGRDQALKVLKRAWDLGINFIDTANVYSRGRSEEIVGELVKGMREDVVIATKVFGQMGNGPNARGLSRKHIMWQVRESLRRLNTGYIDLYQIHRFDYDTPIEETLSTLTDLVHQGLVRYIGASSMWTWQFAKMIYTAEMKGYEKFVSMQNVYNLLYREEEREMIPFCKAHGIGIIPWSPTAAGILSGKYYKDGKIIVPETETRVRPGSGDYRIYVEPPENAEILRRVIEVANNKGATPTQIAYAWLLHKGVTAPIIGTTKPEHVEEAVNAISIKLTDDEVKYLEEPYKPKPVLHIPPPPM